MIPVRSDKKPAINAWSAFQKAPANAQTVEMWSRIPDVAGFAVITGAVSGIVILDFDGEAGRETMARLGLAPHVRTGSGGFHAYFEHPGWRVQTLNSKSKKELGQLYPGLDIRADGGYAVFIGRNDFGQYEHLRPLVPDPLEAIPADVRDYLGLAHPPEPPRPAVARAPGQGDGGHWLEKALGRVASNGRNDSGFWLAMQLRDAGMQESEAAAVMRQYAAAVPSTNMKGQSERYTEAEALASLRQAYSAPAREPARAANGTPRPPAAPPPVDEAAVPQLVPMTDRGNALRLVAAHGKDLAYCHPWRLWLIWDGSRFAPDITGEIFRRWFDANDRMKREELQSLSDPDKAKHLLKWHYESQSRSRIEAAISLARNFSRVAIAPDQLDRDPALLNVLNGTIDLKTGRIRKHERRDLMTKLAPVAHDPNAEAPQWRAFVGQIMLGREPLCEFLQRVIGYSLTGEVSEKSIFVLYGSGNNGKTTFLEIIRSMLGDYAGSIPIESLMHSSKNATGREASPDIAALKGKRFVTTSEAEAHQRLKEGLVKYLTGNQQIQARYLNQDFFEFAPTHKLLADCNHKPQVSGQDRGIWTRIKLIPFQFVAQVIDRELRERLLIELPGILNWALEGAVKWYAGGLKVPAEVQLATQEYQAEMDSLGTFLEECCEKDPNSLVPANAFYKVYCAWAKQAGEYVLSEKVFSRRLAERPDDLEKVRRTAGMFWRGVQVVVEVVGDELKGCRMQGQGTIFESIRNSGFPREANMENPTEPYILHPETQSKPSNEVADEVEY